VESERKTENKEGICWICGEPRGEVYLLDNFIEITVHKRCVDWYAEEQEDYANV